MKKVKLLKESGLLINHRTYVAARHEIWNTYYFYYNFHLYDNFNSVGVHILFVP